MLGDIDIPDLAGHFTIEVALLTFTIVVLLLVVGRKLVGGLTPKEMKELEGIRLPPSLLRILITGHEERNFRFVVYMLVVVFIVLVGMFSTILSGLLNLRRDAVSDGPSSAPAAMGFEGSPPEQ